MRVNGKNATQSRTSEMRAYSENEDEVFCRHAHKDVFLKYN
jgi:hypothetical protein